VELRFDESEYAEYDKFNSFIDRVITRQHEFVNFARNGRWAELKVSIGRFPYLINTRPLKEDGTRRWSVLQQVISGFKWEGKKYEQEELVHFMIGHGANYVGMESELRTKCPVTGEILDNIDKFSQCYNPGFEPPHWSKSLALNFMKECKVFYDNRDEENIEHIRQLARKREPVNIADRGPIECRQYDQDKLNSYFRYREGYYGVCPRSEYLLCPPNILVYTPTPTTLHKRNEGYSIPPEIVFHKSAKIHVLNAYGLAFDAEHQKDYKTYSSVDLVGTKDESIKKVKEFYSNLFNNIFKAAKALGMERIVMSFVGAGFFAQMWWGDETEWPLPSNRDTTSEQIKKNVDSFRDSIWIPQFKAAMQSNSDIKVLFMGVGPDTAESMSSIDIGYFPQPAMHHLTKTEGVDLNTTLLINAWDCWSSPGNGNSNDRSLDGYIGRNTCIGYLGTGFTNPYLLENLVPLT
tara:strand:- start:40 stop:1428 length:1389 start_codon:yes stop_codon:yes gene_type:complete